MTRPAPAPANEARRLAALRECLVLDSAHEPVFDAITQLAATICEVPIALISLVDAERQWFKSRHGLDLDQTPREVAFCAHALLDAGVMEVRNALEDPRFAANPLVLEAPSIRFYAGAPLRDAEGHALGTVCVIDRQPRELTAAQRAALAHLSTVVMRLLEVRRGAFQAELLGRSLDASSSEVYVLDAATSRFVHVNASGLRNTGYRFDELARMSATELLPELDQAWFARALARDRCGEVRSGEFETDARRKDGSRYTVRGSLLLAPTGEVPLLYLVMHDISEQRAAEGAVRAGERRIRTITDNLPALVAYIDAAGRYQFNNATYEQWLQRPLAEITGRTLAEVHEPLLHSMIEPPLQRALSGRRESFEFEYPREGRLHFVRGVFVPERDAHGEVIGVYALTQDATRIRDAEEQLRRLAHFDPLTGLANRNQLRERLQEALARRARDGSLLGLLYLDVDRFKLINDTQGHQVGDEVLCEYGRRLLSRVRQTDTAARLGGDEFAVVLENLSIAEDAECVAASVVKVMEAKFELAGRSLPVTTSVGVALAVEGDTVDSLLARADEALYRAKHAGRGCFRS